MHTTALGLGEDRSISCFLDDIPLSVENDIVMLYNTLHSSLPFFRVYRSMDNVGCYVARSEGDLSEILVFHREQRRLEVLNEMFSMPTASLIRFVTDVFVHFPYIDLISFKAVATAVDRLSFPVQQYNSKDTFVVTLPSSPEAYLASLGKTTRANIRQQINSAKRAFPSFTSQCFVKDEIDADTIRAIVRLSEQRINSKGVKFAHDVDRIIALAQQCGFVVVLLIDGKMRAGSINYHVGTGFFGDVTCYDPEYHRYGLGKLCTYHTICESILRGGRHFYLGGGDFDFKERMLGKRVKMDQVHVYRSYPKVVANLDRAMLAFAHGRLRRFKTTLQQNKDSFSAELILNMLRLIRNKMSK